METEKLFLEATRDAIREGIANKMNGYNSPLDKLLAEVMEKHAGEFRGLMNEAIVSCVSCENFREEVKVAVRRSLAKTLVQKFGGEIEKQVNALKSDPSTRARITLAIDEIVAAKA